MKQHPRIRKTIKWGGAAVTVLLVLVWIGSGWFAFSWTGADGTWCAVCQGRANIGRANPADAPLPATFQRFENKLRRFSWTGHFENAATGWMLLMPLWIPLAPVLLATGIAWRLDTLARRRERLNLCPKCSYDRAGIAGDAKCPECGAMPVVASR
jgi:hypothetical protein